MSKTFSANAQKSAAIYAFAQIVQTADIETIVHEFDSLMVNPMFQSKGWKANFAKMRETLNTGIPSFSIFALGGNKKLPFVAFSTLPGVTCPGAGACLNFCYSFRAWRYPAAVCRQIQNAFLMRFFPNIIRAEFHKIANDRVEFDFRLYVDGDFASSADVGFWFSILSGFPMVRAYGYSKSFDAILEHADNGGILPNNYLLNISSGHNSDDATVDRIRALPITRGEFIAVSINRKVKSSDHGTPENNRAIRQAMGDRKVFPCPGLCGSCTGKGHACGLPQLKGITIAIAIH